MKKLICILLLTLPLFVSAKPAKLFRKGLKNYNKGQYAEALNAFQQALEEAPESAEIFYNLALTQYQTDHPEIAAWAFQQAAGLSNDSALRARCLYNAANSYAALSSATQEKEPQIALNQLRSAIQLYHNALESNPQYIDAAINLERILYRADALREQIKKQQEEQKKNENKKSGSSPSEDSDQENDNEQMQEESFMEESGLYEDADPFGDFSEYEEIHGLPPPNETESAILDQEIRQQEQRKKSRAGRYKSVEKDW